MTYGKPIRILSICDDEAIRISRELVLRQNGYEVESVTGKTGFNPEWIRTFHIAILCHSLSSECAHEIAQSLRQANEGIRLIRMHAICPDNEPFSEIECEVFPTPEALLEAVKGMCPENDMVHAIDLRKRA